MARMHKTVEIDDKTITVHELTVKNIIDLLQDEALSDKNDLSLEGIMKLSDRHLPNATDLKLKVMMKMAPSELKQVYDAFAEVNATFFDTARAAGLDKMLVGLKEAMAEDFSRLLASSLNPVT